MELINENNANINKKEDYIEMPSEEKLKKLQCLMDEVFDENREEILNNLVSSVYNISIYSGFYFELKDKIEKQKLSVDPNNFNDFINNEEYVKKYGIIFSAFISAMVNKISLNNPGKVIELNLKRPINCLLARVSNVKVKGNIAGNYLALGAEESQIYFKEAGRDAGFSMKNSTLILDVAGEYACSDSINSKIFIKKKAGDRIGNVIRNSYIIVNEAGNFLGSLSYNANVTANITKDFAGYSMGSGELNVNVSSRLFGAYARSSTLRANIVMGGNIGKYAKDSKFYIHEIKNFSNKSIAPSFFNDSKNNIYLGKETYEKAMKIPEYQKHKDQIMIWNEEDYKEWNSKMEAKFKELESIDIS